MGAPCYGKVVLRTPAGEKVISENAGASMVWSEDSRFLAFVEWTKDRGQTVFVCRIEDFAIDWLPEFYSVIELHKFKDGWITGINSPASQGESFAVEYRRARVIPRRKRDHVWWKSVSRRALGISLTGVLLEAIVTIGAALSGMSSRLFSLALCGGLMAVGGFCLYLIARRKFQGGPPSTG